MKKNTVKFAKTIADGGFRRRLKDRHVQLIALGGIIGSGYFLVTGEVIHLVGPSVFIAYLLGGLIILLTMHCMGELAVAIPVSGSFVSYSSDLISPAFACGVGWSYWISWIFYIPAECIAGGIILQMLTGINGYIWALGIGLMVTYINLAKVDNFGEIEFWLALIKISALIGFVIVSIFIFFGIIHGPQPPGIIGFKYLLHEGGLLPNGAMALMTAMVLLLVNYQGSEIIGLAAGESENPARMIPHAVRNVTYRILFIYILPVLCLVTIYPWQKAGLSNSVFAEALNFYGLKWAGFATSLITLSASISCANSGFYGTVRVLNALARDGMAYSPFAKLNHNAMPQNAIIGTITAVWIILGFSYFIGQSKLYVALLLVSGFTGTLSWIALCWAQINFRRQLYKAGYTISDLRYVTPYSPYTGILGIVLMLFAMCFLFFNTDPLYKIAFAIGLLFFIIPVLGYKIIPRKESDITRVGFKDVFPDRSGVNTDYSAGTDLDPINPGRYSV